MPPNRELQKKYFNRCKPDEPLDPTDERNVDVDVDNVKARGASCVDAIAVRIELADGPLCELFTGLPGSGKSTELRRLAKRLSDPEGANLFPVLIDAEEVLDLYTAIDVPDVLMAILYKTDAALLKAADQKPEDALKESAVSRFWHWLTTTDVGVSGAEVGAGAEVAVPGGPKLNAGGKLVLDFKSNESLRAEVRRRLAAKMPVFVEKIREAMAELEERARKRGHAGLVILFDSLEKLRGISTTWSDVLKSAEQMFTGGALYLQLPVHVVYTFPTAITFRLHVDMSFLPMLKLFDRQGKRCQDGFDAACAILERRVPESIQNEIFGAANRASRVQRLIEWSGGYPRELVRLLQTFVAQPNLDEDRFKQLLGMAGDSYRRTVPESAHAWLARVHVEKSLPIPTAEHRETADQMLQNNVVLRYQNQTQWFDIHPAVREIPGVKAAIESLRNPAKV